MDFDQLYESCSAQTQRILLLWCRCDDLDLYELLLCESMQVGYEVLTELSEKRVVSWCDGRPALSHPQELR